MKYLVGDIPMEQGQKVEIIFSDGNRERAVYTDTFGYNHYFEFEKGGNIRLSNHFMHLKGIRIKTVD